MSFSAQAAELNDDELLIRLAEWHLGFTTNQVQHDLDLENKVIPRWALSELRFNRIWHDRDDGYWLYYETSQPDVRPDRNEIWRLHRNEQNNLQIDIYLFKDFKKGLTYWGKGSDPKSFEAIEMDEITSRAGCNAVYHWRSELERFVGVNPHGECMTYVGDSYILQHVEISKTEDGTLVRKDWHSFYDDKGVAKRGTGYKFGDQGPYIHLYTERYDLKR